MTEQQALVGFAASVVTEIFKLFPKLNGSSAVKASVSIIVVAIGTFMMTGSLTLNGFVNSLIASYIAYKTIVQPTAQATGLVTQ